MKTLNWGPLRHAVDAGVSAWYFPLERTAFMLSRSLHGGNETALYPAQFQICLLATTSGHTSPETKVSISAPLPPTQKTSFRENKSGTNILLLLQFNYLSGDQQFPLQPCYEYLRRMPCAQAWFESADSCKTQECRCLPSINALT